MKIELAKKLGFCFGVKRAIKLAEENKNSYTFGPLIHNKQEIDRLKNNFNVGLKKDLSDFKTSDKLIIRTHGIEKKDLEILNEKNIEYIDATCPFVTKPQEIVQEMSNSGYEIIIFGDISHPEIRGVMSYVSGNVYVVLNIDDLKKYKLSNKIALVSQTTRNIEDFTEIAKFLISEYKEVRVFNTICNATFENQIAAEELSRKADVMLIIGGRESSNTKQLLKICETYCQNCYHIESADEVKNKWFENCLLCGISAGASTPDWIINNVVERVKNI